MNKVALKPIGGVLINTSSSFNNSRSGSSGGSGMKLKSLKLEDSMIVVGTHSITHIIVVCTNDEMSILVCHLHIFTSVYDDILSSHFDVFYE